MLQGLIIFRVFFAQHARFMGSHKAFGKPADNLTGQSWDMPDDDTFLAQSPPHGGPIRLAAVTRSHRL